MNKTYKGWELIKAINDGKIKSGTQIRVHGITENEDFTLDYWFWGNWFGKEDGYSNQIDNIELYLCNNNVTFEIIEKNETYINNKIDIDNIKETTILNDGMDYYEYENDGSTESGYSKNYSLNDIDTRRKINELVRAVKQLNTELKNRGDLQ
mgnify:FL=1